MQTTERIACAASTGCPSRPGSTYDAWRLNDMSGATAVEVARRLANVLDERDVSYAIGGALALGFYAVPRATVDVDINIFVDPRTQLPLILDVLESAGFSADAEPYILAEQAVQEGQFRGRVSGLRVDVFVPAIPYYASLAERRRQVTLLGHPVRILGPEDLVVLKMVFYRRKDLADVEAVLRDQEHLDRNFVRRTLISLVGADDERIATLSEIERDVDDEAR